MATYVDASSKIKCCKKLLRYEKDYIGWNFDVCLRNKFIFVKADFSEENCIQRTLLILSYAVIKHINYTQRKIHLLILRGVIRWYNNSVKEKRESSTRTLYLVYIIQELSGISVTGFICDQGHKAHIPDLWHLVYSFQKSHVCRSSNGLWKIFMLASRGNMHPILRDYRCVQYVIRTVFCLTQELGNNSAESAEI